MNSILIDFESVFGLFDYKSCPIIRSKDRFQNCKFAVTSRFLGFFTKELIQSQFLHNILALYSRSLCITHFILHDFTVLSLRANNIVYQVFTFTTVLTLFNPIR